MVICVRKVIYKLLGWFGSGCYVRSTFNTTLKISKYALKLANESFKKTKLIYCIGISEYEKSIDR